MRACVVVVVVWLAYYLCCFLSACHEQKEVCCVTDSDFACALQQICQGVM